MCLYYTLTMMMDRCMLCAHINKAYRSPGMQTDARPDASVLQVLDEMRHENVAWQI